MKARVGGMKDKLLAAGMDLFSAVGYRSVSVDQIVNAAGCAKGTFYNHFSSKEAFFLELIMIRMENRTGAVRARMAELEGSREASAESYLRQAAQALVEDINAHPKWFLVFADFVVQSGDEAHFQSEVRRYFEGWVTQITLMIEEMQAKGVVDASISARKTGKKCLALIDGMLSHQNFYEDPFDAELFVESVLQMIRPLQ